jgi:hypothetical protein
MNITEEQLLQLIDPNMPQLAREIIAQEIKMTPDTGLENTPKVVRAQMLILRKLYRLIQFQESPGHLTYEEYRKHDEAYIWVTNTLENLQRNLVPNMSNYFNNGYNPEIAIEELNDRIGGE